MTSGPARTFVMGVLKSARRTVRARLQLLFNAAQLCRPRRSNSDGLPASQFWMALTACREGLRMTGREVREDGTRLDAASQPCVVADPTASAIACAFGRFS